MLLASARSFISVNTSNNFVLQVSGANLSEELRIQLPRGDDKFVRNVFNTNPQIGNVGASDFYAADVEKNYWLGETFEQELVDKSLTGTGVSGIILPIAQASDVTVGPHKNRVGTIEAQAGWFVGQDLGASGSYSAVTAQKLFKFIGTGHGEWLQKKCQSFNSRHQAL